MSCRRVLPSEPEKAMKRCRPDEPRLTFGSMVVVLVRLFACTVAAGLAPSFRVQSALAHPADFSCPFVSFDAGSTPYSIASADFNGDGHLDLVAGNLVLLGDGGGDFLQANVLAEERAVALTVVDVNADGWTDVVVSRGGSNQGSVFLGNGNGTFGPGIDFTVGGVGGSVAAGDLNSDGRMDIAVSNSYQSNISVL